jgi:hypothetical protein
MKKERVCFSETLTSTYASTLRRNPEEQHHHEVKVYGGCGNIGVTDTIRFGLGANNVALITFVLA